MARPYNTRIRGVACLVALALAGPAAAAPPRLSPEKTEELRGAVRAKAAAETSAEARADVLARAAEDLGDPVLLLDAAEELRETAAERRSTELARTAFEPTAVALDIVAYLAEGEHYAQTTWRPVTAESLETIRSRAQQLQVELERLIEEIEAERAAAAAAANRPPPEKKKLRPGTGLIAGGAAMLVGLGGGGLGLLAAGLFIGADTQRQVEALDLPMQRPEYDRLDAQGKRANLMVYIGGALAAVGVGVGAGLLAVGVKKRRGAGSGEADTARLLLAPSPGGLALRGRF